MKPLKCFICGTKTTDPVFIDTGKKYEKVVCQDCYTKEYNRGEGMGIEGKIDKLL
jgi:hypothetical protein